MFNKKRLWILGYFFLLSALLVRADIFPYNGEYPIIQPSIKETSTFLDDVCNQNNSLLYRNETLWQCLDADSFWNDLTSIVNPFDQWLNTTSNVLFDYITSSNSITTNDLLIYYDTIGNTSRWEGDMLINEANLLVSQNGGDTGHITAGGNITAGGVICDSTGCISVLGNPFDQILNQSSYVEFAGTNITDNLCFDDGEVTSCITSWGGFYDDTNISDTNLSNGGSIAGNLTPSTNSTYSFGSNVLKWLNGFFTNIFATDIQTENLTATDTIETPNLNVTTQASGTPLFLAFSRYTTTGEFWFVGSNGVSCDTTRGYVMARNGSIVSWSHHYDFNSLINDGNSTLEIKVDNVDVITLDKTHNSSSWGNNEYQTYPIGEYRFYEGDIIHAYFDFNERGSTLAGQSRNHLLQVEIVWD